MGYLCNLLFLLFLQSVFGERIHPNDSKIKYMGRFNKNDPNSFIFDWGYTQIKAWFSGDSISVYLEFNSGGGDNYFNIMVDGLLKEVAYLPSTVSAGNSIYIGGLGSGDHSIIIHKRTEGASYFGAVRFGGFEAPNGLNDPPAPEGTKKKALFFGDSFTAAAGNEQDISDSSPTRIGMNSWLGYPNLIAQNYNLDYQVIAISGHGVCRNGGSSIPLDPDAALPHYKDLVCASTQNVDCGTIDKAEFVPDFVFIFLGINDFNGGVPPTMQQYRTCFQDFANSIKTDYPAVTKYFFLHWEHPTSVSYGNEQLALASEFGDAVVLNMWVPLTTDGSTKDDTLFGWGSHPNVAGHQALFEFIKPEMDQYIDLQDCSYECLNGAVCTTSAPFECVCTGTGYTGPDCGTPILPPSTSEITFDKFWGTNAFIVDEIDKLKAFGIIREYHLWGYNVPDNYQGDGSDILYEFSRFYGDWDFDDYYQQLVGAGVEVAPVIWKNNGWQAEGNDEDKPLDFAGANAEDPNSYSIKAEFMWQYAARYGSTAHPESSLKVGEGETCTQTKRSGLNLIKYFENWNEQDKDWFGDASYFTPAAYAAMTSADYDGHCNSMSGNVGVINADPNAKMVMGGVATLDTQYVSEMKAWFDANRAGCERVWPLDAVNFHHYCNAAGDQGAWPWTFGESPEANDLKTKVLNVKNWIDQNVPGTEFWLTEFGYDVAPNSDNRVQTISGKTMDEVWSEWIQRTFLILSSAGVDRAVQFMYHDMGEITDLTGRFGASGFATCYWNCDPKPYGLPKKGYWDAVAMANVALKDLMFVEVVVESASIYVYKYANSAGDIEGYALWSPTQDGSHTSYDLSVGNSGSAKLIKLDGTSTGTQTDVNIQSGGSISISRVDELPCFIRLHVGSDSNCIPECKNGAVCIDSECVCDNSQWHGNECDIPVCASGCGHGNCTAPGICSCEAGWKNHQPLISGAQCMAYDCGNPECSGHGSCVLPGICLCESDEYSGQFCGIYEGGDDDSAECSDCQYGDCDSSDGICSCWSYNYDWLFYEGDNCDEIVCYNCNQDQISECIAPKECDCNAEYCGEGCWIRCESQNCNPDCKHGTCEGSTCTCSQGWKGPGCTQAICDEYPCLNGGHCIAPNACECAEGYRGRTCEIASVNRHSTDDDCGVDIECVYGDCGIDGLCLCFSGFYGSACDSFDCFGDDDCSGNGECLSPDNCQCESSTHHGLKCNHPIFPGSVCFGIPSESPGVCSSNGYCEDDKCSCDVGFEGEDCLYAIRAKKNEEGGSNRAVVVIISVVCGVLLVLALLLSFALLGVVVFVCVRKMQKRDENFQEMEDKE